MSASLALDFELQIPAARRVQGPRSSPATPRVRLASDRKLGLDCLVPGALDFFVARTTQSARTGSPYLAQDKDDRPGLALQEFTVEIRITGAHRGSALVSASRAMLTIMLMRMGSTDITTMTMSAALRELAASIAESIRSSLGDEVVTWSPAVAPNGTRRYGNPGRAPLVAPIHWRNYTANIALWLE